MKQNKILLWSLIFIFAIYDVSYGQNIRQEIKVKEKVSTELVPGETHNYQISVNENNCVYIVVEQIGIDVVVNMYNPKGEKVFSIDSPNGVWGPEPVFYIAQQNGVYRLEVVSPNSKVSAGKYEVLWKDLHLASEDDKVLAMANQIFSETEELQVEGKLDSLKQRKENYQKLLQIYNEAITKYTKATVLELFLRRIADVTLRLGQIDFSTERYTESIEKYQNALAYENRNTIKNPDFIGNCFANIGESLRKLGDEEGALKNYLKSLSYYSEGHDMHAKLVAINNIGSIYDVLGNKKESLEYYIKAFNLAKILDDQLLQGTLCSNLALVFEDLEEHQEALNYYQKSLEIFTKNKRTWNAGVVESNIGSLYDDLGNSERAIQYYQNAIKRFDEAGTLISKAKTLVNLGSIYMNQQNRSKNFETAKNYYSEALNIFKSKNDLRGMGNVYTKIGALQLNTDPKESISTLEKALELRKQTSDFYGEAYTHLVLGNAYYNTRNYTKAFEQYTESLQINTKIGDKKGESATLYQIATLQRKTNELEKAKATIEKGINIVEQSRLNVSINNLRVTYLERSQAFYELYVNILMELGYSTLAFEISEKSRCRSLLENLSKSNDKDINPELISDQRVKTLALNRQVEKIITLKKEDRVGEIPEVENQIEKLKNEIETLESEIQKTKPLQRNAKPLTLVEIQQNVLDEETAIIEYSLGQENSYAWVVTKNSIKVFKLPSRKVIEGLSEQVFHNLTVRENQTVFSDENEIKLGDTKYIETSKKLSEMIVEPLVEKLAQKRIIFVPDGKLTKIPFLALPLQGVPLISNFEITGSPSASVLGVILNSEVVNHQKTIAVVADPVFDLSDERISKNKENNSKEMEIVLREKIIQRRGVEFHRLPFTQKEGETIISLVPKYKKYDKYIGFDANLETILENLNKYNIVHFATHAISEDFHKGISAILLSLVNKEGKAIDGVFSSDVVANLDINLDMVVLSACDTARGKVFAGEGTIGLARSFIYAGAKSVITTGWEVNDEATAELMKRFYVEIFQNKFNYSTALRQAQLSMLKNKKYSHPFFWAPFSFQGNYTLGENHK